MSWFWSSGGSILTLIKKCGPQNITRHRLHLSMIDNQQSSSQLQKHIVSPIIYLQDKILGQEKKFGSGQLIFENWSGGPVAVFFFFEPRPKFSKSNKSQQAEMMPIQSWQPGGVRCRVSGAGSRRTAFQAWRKPGVGGWRGHIGLFRSHL